MALVAGLGLAPASAQAAAPGQAAPRIVGGAAVAPNAAPFQVALLTRPGQGDDFADAQCGGTVVGPRHVVTAAHCIFDEGLFRSSIIAPRDLEVLAGVTRLRSAGDAPYDAGHRRVRVKSLTPHPLYAGKAAEVAFDAAVIELAAPLYAGEPQVGDGSSIAPLPLVTDDPAVGTPVTFYGWGNTAAQPIEVEKTGRRAFPRGLRAVTLAIQDRDACRNSNRLFAPIHFCAGPLEGGRGTCNGDSGGPGVVAGPAGPVLAGIVSYGLGCAARGYPGIDTRISHPAIGDFLRATIAGEEWEPPAGTAAAGRPAKATDRRPRVLRVDRSVRLTSKRFTGRYRVDEDARTSLEIWVNGRLIAFDGYLQRAGTHRIRTDLLPEGQAILRRARKGGRRVRLVWRVVAHDPAGNKTATSLRRAIR